MRVTHITTLLVAYACMSYSPISRSAQFFWPYVTKVRVMNCGSETGYYCGTYDMQGELMLMPSGSPTIKRPTNGAASWYGIHCQVGSLEQGIRYGNCGWNRNSHGPRYPDVCAFVNADLRNWDLSPTCSFPSQWEWGTHHGADAGGECAAFGIYSAGVLWTPHGSYSAEEAANGGSSACVKGTPPTIPCTVDPLPPIEHGTRPTHGAWTGTSRTRVSCGANPQASIVGGTEIDFADGLKSRLGVSVRGNDLEVTSYLTADDAVPGNYAVSKVVVVSPM